MPIGPVGAGRLANILQRSCAGQSLSPQTARHMALQQLQHALVQDGRVGRTAAGQ